MIGLSLALRVTIFAICIILFILIFRLIGQGRLQVRYSLLWMVLLFFMLLCAVFPGSVSAVAGLLGFEYSSNFIFSAGIGSLLLIALSLSMVASWQARYIRRLVQTIALLDNRVEKLEREKPLKQEKTKDM